MDTEDRVNILLVDDQPGKLLTYKAILEELGEPTNLLKVEAKPLWDDYFRVNVYTQTDVGLNAKEIAVSDSFFVFKSEAGFLSNPPIVRKYDLV